MNIKKYSPLILLIVVTLLAPQISFASYRSSSSFKRQIEKLDTKVLTHLPIPIVFGVEPSQLTDTYNDARSGGRVHNAIDIFAPRGSLVASPSPAVVTKITGDQGSGGIQVWTANPGGEEYFFAHLDAVYPDLKEGDVLSVGDLIGFVGNTGNAIHASPHLHFAIYAPDGTSLNPYERLNQSFERKEKIKSIMTYIQYLQGLLDEMKRKNR